jgi:hypothetical protein
MDRLNKLGDLGLMFISKGDLKDENDLKLSFLLRVPRGKIDNLLEILEASFKKKLIDPKEFVIIDIEPSFNLVGRKGWNFTYEAKCDWCGTIMKFWQSLDEFKVINTICVQCELDEQKVHCEHYGSEDCDCEDD